MLSWDKMARELAGQCPVPFPFAKTLVNRAWLEVQGSWLWSFLVGDASVPTPSPVTAGTVTATLGSNQVVGDATAAAAWAAIGLVNPITTQQFRIGQGTIYNIIAFDGVNTITLDRLYVDPPSGAGQSYMILGVYYNAPVQDFVWWESLRDPVNGYTLSTTVTREYADAVDPQRFQSGWPSAAIPYKVNSQAGNFNGFPVFELWPTPLNNTTYVGTYFRSGSPFVNGTDTPIPPLSDDIVIEMGKMLAYEWCQANPDKCPKADYRYLYQQSRHRYDNDGKGGSMLDRYILRDEQFSGRGRIDIVDGNYRNALPWVSQKANVMYAP